MVMHQDPRPAKFAKPVLAFYHTVGKGGNCRILCQAVTPVFLVAMKTTRL